MPDATSCNGPFECGITEERKVEREEACDKFTKGLNTTKKMYNDEATSSPSIELAINRAYHNLDPKVQSYIHTIIGKEMELRNRQIREMEQRHNEIYNRLHQKIDDLTKTQQSQGRRLARIVEILETRDAANRFSLCLVTNKES